MYIYARKSSYFMVYFKMIFQYLQGWANEMVQIIVPLLCALCCTTIIQSWTPDQEDRV